jgi:Tfp pilus assembly protein PilV
MNPRSTSDRPPAARQRQGIALIEVVVACTLLAVTLTALTGVAARMAARTRNVGVVEQRTATYFQEVNRVESMPYDSLSTGRFLVTDSTKSGNSYYVWSYTVGAETANTAPAGTSLYRDITLTVTPRVTGGTPVSGVIRRARAPSANSFNTGP